MSDMIAATCEVCSRIRKISQPAINVLIDSGIARRELLHSDLIWTFLDPRRDKEGAKRLEIFLKILDAHKPKNLGAVEVTREEDHVDILLRYVDCNDIRRVIIIENKVDAGDQPEQLARYVKDFLDEDYSREQITVKYLTPLGNRPSEQSVGEYQELVQEISYKKEMTEWLEECQKANLSESTLENIRIYKEAVEYMGAKEDNLKEAIDHVFEAGIEPESARVVLQAAQRRCHYEFLKCLCAEMITKAKKKGLELKVDKYLNIEDAREASASGYGFAFAVTERVSYGISFDSRGNDNFYLYTGLFYRGNERDDETARSIEAQRKKIGLGSDGSDSNWYIWIKTGNSSTIEDGSFNSTAAIEYESSEIWKGWARDYSEIFLADYEKLSKLVPRKA